jgi:type IV pilus assembly protein PilV
MALTVISNKRGFTLVEFLVAMVIMMVGILGLLQTVNYAIHHNMNNQLRQEATLLADDLMNREKAKPFDLISTTPAPYSRTYPNNQRIVNGASRNYSVIKTNTELTTQTKTIDLQISWDYKQDHFVHSISSLTSKYE